MVEQVLLMAVLVEGLQDMHSKVRLHQLQVLLQVQVHYFLEMAALPEMVLLQLQLQAVAMEVAVVLPMAKILVLQVLKVL